MNSLSIALVGAQLSASAGSTQQTEYGLPLRADWRGFLHYLGLTKGSRILLTLETPELTAMLQVVLQAAGMQVRVLPWNEQYLQPGDAWCREVEAYDPDWCFLTSALHLELPFSYWGRVCWEQDLRWQLEEFSLERAA